MRLILICFSLTTLLLSGPSHAQQFSDETVTIETMAMDGSFGNQAGIMSGVMATPVHPTIAFGGTSLGSPDMMMSKLFTPAMIMRNQAKLNLSSKQTDAIKKQMRTFQSNIVDVQWDLNSSSAALNKDLAEEKIDIDKTLRQIDKVLAAENRMKKMHLSMLIEIHNILNKNQIKTLRKNLHPHFMSFSSSSIDDVLVNE
ncbi:MAG: hypothetical protein GKR93_02530 [Gammaproteobacteria bacterium]|nr:hypothetical protein [Gammaproteobacteria bacterium]